MDPYGYVNGNPETKNDPTGRYIVDGNGNGYRQVNNVIPYRRRALVPFKQDDQDWSPIPVVTCTPGMPGCYGPPTPRPTQAQITKWCNSNAGCSGALTKFHNSQLHVQVNIIFPFFPLDPEYSAQAYQDMTSFAEYNQYLLDLAREPGSGVSSDIIDALKSADEGVQAEGQAGTVASLYSRVIGFNVKYDLSGAVVTTPRGPGGEVDVETPEAIIEAKSGELQGETRNIVYKYTNTITNPTGKPFVIYAPGWNARQVATITARISGERGPSFYVATSPDELIGTLQYIQAGEPKLP